MRFLVDNQLPIALVRFLSSTGSDSQHVLDAGPSQASDPEIWSYAAEHHLVLISKDEDFFHRATQPGVAVQLIWIRMGNCRKADLLAAVERSWSRVCTCLEAGERIVEVR